MAWHQSGFDQMIVTGITQPSHVKFYCKYTYKQTTISFKKSTDSCNVI